MSREISPKAWAALAAVYLIWGSTYLAIRYVVETMPPLIAASFRWIPAGVILYAIGARGEDRPTADHWRNAAIIGVALVLGGNGLVSIAERRIASGTAALLVATVPLFIALFEWLGFRARLTPVTLAGLVVGFAGTAVLMLPRSGGGSTDAVGALTVLAASASWAAGSLYARRAALPSRPMLSTGMQMICGGVALMIVGAVGGEWGRFHPGQISRDSVIALVYLAVFGSIVAFSAYTWLLRNVRTTIVSTYAYVNPLVAVLLGRAIKDEPLTTATLIGGVAILVSVAAIVLSAPPTERARADLAGEKLAT